MLLSSILPIIFSINLIPVSALHTSVTGLSKILHKHPRSPLILLIKTDTHHNTDILRTIEENIQDDNEAQLLESIVNVVEIEKGQPTLSPPYTYSNYNDISFKIVSAENVLDDNQNDHEIKANQIDNKLKKDDKIYQAQRAIGYWLQKLQIKDSTILDKLKKQLTTLRNKYKRPLRSKHSSKYANEENENYHQKSNKAVYNYLMKHQRSRTVHKKKNMIRQSYCDDYGSTKGPNQDKCASKEQGSTQVGPKGCKTSKATKPKITGSTKSYKDDDKDNCMSVEMSTKAGIQSDEVTEANDCDTDENQC